MSFFKKLIFESENKPSKKVTEESVKFPETKATIITDEIGQFNATPVETNTSSAGWQTQPLVCDPYMEEVLAKYESGLEGLNQPGYDFYEFFQAIVQSGVDKPEMYKMALTMAQAMDKSVTKTSLLSQSDFYVEEINKVHSNFSTAGAEKLTSLRTQKSGEESSLRTEASNIETQIAQLRSRQNQITSELSGIDYKYAPQINEVECKIKANDNARDKIISSINKVKQGINTNI